MEANQAGSSGILCPKIQGWTATPETAVQAGNQLKLTKENITYEIAIPEDPAAREALDLALKEIVKLTNAEDKRLKDVAAASGMAPAPFLGLAALPFSELSRQFAYTVRFSAAEDKTITLRSPVANAAEGYTPYIEYGDTIYASNGDKVFQTTQDKLGTESIAQKIKSYNPKSSADLTDVTYDLERTRQFQNPNNLEQNIDGEKIARTFGIPYQRDMVFDIFESLKPEDKTQFFVPDTAKEELTPEQKFEDFLKGQYKYNSTKYSVQLAERIITIKPLFSSNTEENSLIYTISADSEHEKLAQVLSSLSATAAKPLSFYQQGLEYSAKSGALETEFRKSNDESSVFISKSDNFMFILKIPSMVSYKIPNEFLVQDLNSILANQLIDSNEIKPSIFGFFEIPNAAGKSELINIQWLSNFLNIPIINAEHGSEIYNALPDALKEIIKKDCRVKPDKLFDEFKEETTQSQPKISLKDLREGLQPITAEQSTHCIQKLNELLTATKTNLAKENELLPHGDRNPLYETLQIITKQCSTLIEMLERQDDIADITMYLKRNLIKEPVVDILGNSFEVQQKVPASKSNANNSKTKTHKKPAKSTTAITEPIYSESSTATESYFQLLQLFRNTSLRHFSEKMPLSEDCLKTFDPIIKLFSSHSTQNPASQPDEKTKEKLIQIIFYESRDKIRQFVNNNYLQSAEQIALSKVPDIISALATLHCSPEKASNLRTELAKLALSNKEIETLFKEILTESDASVASAILSEKITALYQAKRGILTEQIDYLQTGSRLYTAEQTALSKVSEIVSLLEQDSINSVKNARRLLSGLHLNSDEITALLKIKEIDALSTQIKILYAEKQKQLLAKTPQCEEGSPINKSNIAELLQQTVLYKAERHILSEELKKHTTAPDSSPDIKTADDYALKILFSSSFSSSSSRFFIYNAIISESNITEYTRKDFDWEAEFKKYHICDKREQSALKKLFSIDSAKHLAQASSQIKALFLDRIDGKPVHIFGSLLNASSPIDEMKRKSDNNNETVNNISRKILSLLYSTPNSIILTAEDTKQAIRSHLRQFFPESESSKTTTEDLEKLIESIYEERQKRVSKSPEAKKLVLKDFIEYQKNLSHDLFPSISRGTLESSPSNKRMLAFLIANDDVKISTNFFSNDIIADLLKHRKLSKEKGSDQVIEISDILALIRQLTEESGSNQDNSILLSNILTEVGSAIDPTVKPEGPKVGSEELRKIAWEIKQLSAHFGYDDPTSISVTRTDSLNTVFSIITAQQKILSRANDSNPLLDLPKEELQKLLAEFILLNSSKITEISEADRIAYLSTFIKENWPKNNETNPITLIENAVSVIDRRAISQTDIEELNNLSAEFKARQIKVKMLSESIMRLQEAITSKEKERDKTIDPVGKQTIKDRISNLKSEKALKESELENETPTLKDISKRYHEKKSAIQTQRLIKTIGNTIKERAQELLGEPLSVKSLPFLKTRFIPASRPFPLADTSKLDIIPPVQSKSERPRSQVPAPGVLEILPAVAMPAQLSVQKQQKKQKKSKLTNTEEKPTSALTNRLKSLLENITESTHPSVLLNDLLHENKKPSI